MGSQDLQIIAFCTSNSLITKILSLIKGKLKDLFIHIQGLKFHFFYTAINVQNSSRE